MGFVTKTLVAIKVLMLAALAWGCTPVVGLPLTDLRAAIEAVEPMWPRVRVVRERDLQLPDAHPDRDALRFLRERDLIASDTAVDPVTLDVWSALLRTLTDGVRQTALPAGDPSDVDALRNDIEAFAGKYAAAVRPLALIARSTQAPNDVSFLGLVWNYSPYPRLMVYRPNDTQRVEADPLVLAASLATCAVPVNQYVSAPEPEARALFVSHPDVRMFVVASEPDMRGRWPFEVERGREAQVFAFDHPIVDDLQAFSAVFVGDSAPVLSLLRVLPSLRTNVSPLALPSFLMTP